MKKNNWLLPVAIILVLCLLVSCLAVLAFFWLGGRPAGPANLPTLIPAGHTPIAATPYTTGASPVIYLAGRTDVAIPPHDAPEVEALFTCRPTGQIAETRPPGYSVAPGATFTFRATGIINFYGGPLEEGYPPDGDTNGSMADLEGYGGLSGYVGPAGALLGVFLDDNIPNGTAPERLSFRDDATGLAEVDFLRLEPGLGQIFFIGDGLNNGQAQTFAAPAGATRLFIGLADGSAFVGTPSCYTDNVGSFSYTLQSSSPFAPLP